MQELQNLIDKRASDKLESEIREIDDFLRKREKILKNLRIYYEKEGKREYTDATFIFYENRLGDELYKVNIEEYRKNESEKFVREVEELKNKVQQLEDEINYLQ